MQKQIAAKFFGLKKSEGHWHLHLANKIVIGARNIFQKLNKELM